MDKRLLIFFVIFIILISPVIAKTKPDSFVDYATEVIYTDCEGKDIILNLNGEIRHNEEKSHGAKTKETENRYLARLGNTGTHLSSGTGLFQSLQRRRNVGEPNRTGRL